MPDAVDDRDFRVECAAPISFDLLDHLGRKVVARVVAESHVRTFARKHIADCRTNATRSSSDERLLSLKQKTHLAMWANAFSAV